MESIKGRAEKEEMGGLESHIDSKAMARFGQWQEVYPSVDSGM